MVTLRPFLLVLFLSGGHVLGSSGASVDSCLSYGDPESQLEVRLSDLLASRDLLARTAAEGTPVTTRGTLDLGMSPLPYLCVPERGQCLLLGFDWDAIGIQKEELAPILSQWAGSEVVVSGFLSTDSVRSLIARGIRLIEKPEPVPRSYCVGYTGPLQPSAEEQRVRRLGVPTVCSNDQWIPFHGGRAAACLEEYEPVIWLGQFFEAPGTLRLVPSEEPLTFDLPAPYAARDIWEFTPVTEEVHLLTLFDGRLFSLAGGRLRELDGPKVDQLSRLGEPDVVYYRLRKKTAEGAPSVAELRAVDEQLAPRTLWSSAMESLNYISVQHDRPLTLFVEDRSGAKRILVRSDDGEWVPSQ